MSGLSKKIAANYDLIGIVPGEVIIGGVSVDFRTISKDKADALFKNGCRYLRKKEKPKRPPKTTEN